MNKGAKIAIGFLMGLFLLSGCNNKESSSPYDDILKQQPFSSLTDSIKNDNSNNELYFRRAVLLNKNNFPEPALADFQKAWSLKKEEKYALGISTLLLQSKPDSALVFLSKALKELPGSYLLQLTLARAYEVKNETDNALLVCDQIIHDHPQQVEVLKLKADLLDKKEETDSAIQVLEKAYQLAPFDIDLNYSLAFKYAENKNPKTISLCDSIIAKDSLHLHAEPYYYKGIYFSNINNKAKALSLFDEAIGHDYNFLNAYIEKGSAQYDQKKFANALKTFELANTISPKFPDAWFWIGKCQEALGDKENARINYLKAYGLDQTFTDAKEAADKLK
ncbi:MAG: tetratricopeptide repeat protein [Sphingobacteriales bacterium]|nr:tetratricopeptide repeat protein [Sphingobacteriales bacterium]